MSRKCIACQTVKLLPSGHHLKPLRPRQRLTLSCSWYSQHLRRWSNAADPCYCQSHGILRGTTYESFLMNQTDHPKKTMKYVHRFSHLYNLFISLSAPCKSATPHSRLGPNYILDPVLTCTRTTYFIYPYDWWFPCMTWWVLFIILSHGKSVGTSALTIWFPYIFPYMFPWFSQTFPDFPIVFPHDFRRFPHRNQPRGCGDGLPATSTAPPWRLPRGEVQGTGEMLGKSMENPWKMENLWKIHGKSTRLGWI